MTWTQLDTVRYVITVFPLEQIMAVYTLSTVNVTSVLRACKDDLAKKQTNKKKRFNYYFALGFIYFK